MALRWIEGFETFGNVSDDRSVWGDSLHAKYHGRAEMGWGSPSLVSGYRDMGLGLSFSNLTYNYFQVPLDTQPSLVVGLAYYIPSSVYYFGETLVRLRDAGTKQLWLAVLRDMGGGSAGTHEIVLVRGTTIIDSLGFYAPSQWLYVELKATIHNTAGSYECRVRGVTQCSATGVDTSNTSNNHTDNVLFGFTTGYVDDIYILDGATGQTDFLGEVKVESGLPTSDSSVQWSRSGGSSNYEAVDENPVSETDYIYSQTPDDLDLFGMASCGSPQVKGAQLTVDSKLSVPGGKDLILVCDSNGSQQTKSFRVGEGDERVVQSLLTDIDPDTSAAWTQTGINAAAWGVKVG